MPSAFMMGLYRASFSVVDAPAVIHFNAFHNTAKPVPIFSTGTLLSNVQRSAPNSSIHVSM